MHMHNKVYPRDFSPYEFLFMCELGTILSFFSNHEQFFINCFLCFRGSNCVVFLRSSDSLHFLLSTNEDKSDEFGMGDEKGIG
ncbi:hypothetical protein EUGRSUZ_K00257 [Eucalyptus grandis]|uniref:Uncharacterized protein n=2 Tax=Eucalyptus grandis TaxID=71139 RepID=A0ACC3IRW0_EUCGR|nr:hypothetical protein EUGRSUZ_K00257 [Eucalyptus grandis]